MMSICPDRSECLCVLCCHRLILSLYAVCMCMILLNLFHTQDQRFSCQWQLSECHQHTDATEKGGSVYTCISHVLEHCTLLSSQVCNHPDLFEPRPIISPFRMLPLEFYTASLVFKALERPPFEVRRVCMQVSERMKCFPKRN